MSTKTTSYQPPENPSTSDWKTGTGDIATISDRRVRLVPISADDSNPPSLYTLCRQWMYNNPNALYKIALAKEHVRIVFFSQKNFFQQQTHCRHMRSTIIYTVQDYTKDMKLESEQSLLDKTLDNATMSIVADEEEDQQPPPLLDFLAQTPPSSILEPPMPTSTDDGIVDAQTFEELKQRWKSIGIAMRHTAAVNRKPHEEKLAEKMMMMTEGQRTH